MKAKLRWGILGCARIAVNAFAPAVRGSGSGELLAVASRNEEKAKETARALGIPRAYGSYEDLLLDDAVEAVYIALPNHLHKDWTIKSAEKGKHVLCEKPLALNAQECDEMFAACGNHGVRLVEAFMYRCHPRTVLVKKIVDSGEIGEVKLIRSTFSSPFPADRFQGDIRSKKDFGGGCLFDLGCYCLNVSRYFMGADPEEVYATANIHPSLGVDMSVEAILSFSSGRRSVIDCSFERAANQFCDIVGTEGWIAVTTPFGPGKDRTEVVVRKGSEVEVHRVESADQFRLEVEQFGQCVREDAAPAVSPDDSLGNARTLDALFSSMKTGQRVVCETATK